MNSRDRNSRDRISKDRGVITRTHVLALVLSVVIPTFIDHGISRAAIAGLAGDLDIRGGKVYSKPYVAFPVDQLGTSDWNNYSMFKLGTEVKFNGRSRSLVFKNKKSVAEFERSHQGTSEFAYDLAQCLIEKTSQTPDVLKAGETFAYLGAATYESLAKRKTGYEDLAENINGNDKVSLKFSNRTAAELYKNNVPSALEQRSNFVDAVRLFFGKNDDSGRGMPATNLQFIVYCYPVSVRWKLDVVSDSRTVLTRRIEFDELKELLIDKRLFSEDKGSDSLSPAKGEVERFSRLFDRTT